MIATDKRKAIYWLHQQGLSCRRLARQFGLSRNTIRQIIALKGELPAIDRQDKQPIDPELLRRLYEQCQGRVAGHRVVFLRRGKCEKYQEKARPA